MSTTESSPEKEEPVRRILIIDDEPSLTSMIRLNLELTGKYEVREENISTKAMDSIHEFKPCLIILDVMMPGLDGADIMYRIQNDPALQDIPVVFHTATVRKTELDTHGGLISGFPFIPKPAKVDQLIRIIEENLPDGSAL